MSKKKSSVAGLGALYARVCGMDVHKKLCGGVRAHPQCEGWHGAEHAAASSAR